MGDWRPDPAGPAGGNPVTKPRGLLAIVLGAEEDGAAIGALIERLPAESLEALARRYLTPSAIRRRRDEERDQLYRALAAGHAEAGSGRDLARAIVAELDRYRGASWRFERAGLAPAEPRRAMMHRVLTLSGGTVLAFASVRRILAGVAQNQPRF